MRGDAEEGTGLRLTGSTFGAVTCWWDEGGGLDVEEG